MPPCASIFASPLRFPKSPPEKNPTHVSCCAVLLYVDPNALTLPAPAILTGQQGTYVYTIDTAETAKQTPVQIARTFDTVAVIASGLREGQQVVVDGQSRLIPGSKVAIKGVPR